MISKTCMITICGRPNVGKSTLANTLAGEKIAIVSDKPQTTRNRITAICSRGETQFVFMDTPGFHKPRTRLGDYMVGVVRQSVADVDAVVLVVEPVAALGPQERELIRGFAASGVPAVLAVNKIDTVEPQTLLAVIAAYAEAHDFAAVVPISAQNGDGVEELLAELAKFAVDSEPLFDEGVTTDQTAPPWRSRASRNGITASSTWRPRSTARRPATRGSSSESMARCSRRSEKRRGRISNSSWAQRSSFRPG